MNLEPQLAEACHKLYPNDCLPEDRQSKEGWEAWKAASIGCGHDAAASVWGDCSDRIASLVERISALPAVTVAGVAVKANALLWDMFLWEGTDEEGAEQYNVRVFRAFIAEMKRVEELS